jgi:adenylylsulfate kinase
MSGWVIWLTGIPGSGKSTLARLVAGELHCRHVAARVLSVEMVRAVLTPRPKYTEQERDVVYSALVFVSKMLARNGANVIIDATANRRRYRNKARRGITRFAEIYLKCPLEICMKRERRRRRRFGAPSHIYAKARTGASKTVPGIGVPYEVPLSPELTVDTSRLKPKESSEQITHFVLTKLCHQPRLSTAKR